MTVVILMEYTGEMKPSDMIKHPVPIDWTQRALDALAGGALSQSALRIFIKMTSPSAEKRYWMLLDDLAARGLIRVWRETSRDRPGRPAVMVALAAPAASGSTIGDGAGLDPADSA